MLNIKLTQNYIVLENPYEKKESKVELLEETKKKMSKEEAEKQDRLKVLKVGVDCKYVKEGDYVLVMLERINEFALRMIEGKGYIVLRENDVIAIYETDRVKSDIIIN